MKRLFSALLFVSVILSFSPGMKSSRRATLIAVGDNLIHTSVYMGAETGAGYDFSPVYAAVAKAISGADIALVNQETMLGEKNFSGYPRFCSPCEVGNALIGAGFDVINIANNHSLDMGDEGFIFTDAYLSSVAECVIGDGKIKTVERNGIKIAFLSYTVATNYGLSSVVSRYDASRAAEDIKEAKNIADAVVVMMHWGVEYDTPRFHETYEPTEYQIQTARLLCEYGADVIIGSHPHVIERVEWVEADGNRALCAYSLGNFVSNMRYGGTMLGGMLTLEFVKTTDGVIVKNPKIVPTVCHYGKDHRGHTVLMLKDYTDEMAAAHGTQNEGNERHFCREMLVNIYENNISLEFRAAEY
ncbi:MAG: CapA family protein [Clostridia bacterium]|nr:CapA family protein [Clostridia bacterium]